MDAEAESRLTLNGLSFQVAPSGTLKITADDSARSRLRFELAESGADGALDALAGHAIDARLEATRTATGLLAFRELEGDRPWDLKPVEGGRVWVFTESAVS